MNKIRAGERRRARARAGRPHVPKKEVVINPINPRGGFALLSLPPHHLPEWLGSCRWLPPPVHDPEPNWKVSTWPSLEVLCCLENSIAVHTKATSDPLPQGPHPSGSRQAARRRLQNKQPPALSRKDSMARGRVQKAACSSGDFIL